MANPKQLESHMAKYLKKQTSQINRGSILPKMWTPTPLYIHGYGLLSNSYKWKLQKESYRILQSESKGKWRPLKIWIAWSYGGARRTPQAPLITWKATFSFLHIAWYSTMWSLLLKIWEIKPISTANFFWCQHH